MNSGHLADAAADAMQAMPIRASILDLAKEAITVDRHNTHGSAEENFWRVAAIWSAHLNTPVTATDVASMMCMFKLARIKANAGHLDNWTDLIGYAALGAEIAANAEGGV